MNLVFLIAVFGLPLYVLLAIFSFGHKTRLTLYRRILLLGFVIMSLIVGEVSLLGIWIFFLILDLAFDRPRS